MTTRDASNQVYVTAEGLTQMKQELEHLRTVRRREVADLIQKAKEIGDITDSAQYEAAKDEQAFLEGRIRFLEDVVGRAILIKEDVSSAGEVRVGSRVTLRDSEGNRETWTIVGRAEADVAKGRISNESPVGKALLGKKAGAKVEVSTPGGPLKLSIVSVG